MPVDLRANAGNDEGRLAEITWHNEKRAIRDLIPYEVNPRQITNKQAKDLKASLAKFGIADPLIINTDNMIIGGHQRKKILETLLGYDPDFQIDVRVPDRELSIDEARELNVRLNKNVADWDFDILANNFELDDLLDWGFDKQELDLDLWAGDAPEDVEPQIDKAEELREKWGVESGQLWKLGEHRLICGDCTDKAVVDKVMGGEKAELVITDPPYNIGNRISNIAAESKTQYKTYSAIKKAKWDREFDILPALEQIQNVLSGNCAVYVFTSHFFIQKIWEWMDKWARYSNYCVWVKPNPAPSIAKRHWTWATELVAYAVNGKQICNFPKKGHALNWWNVVLSSKSVDEIKANSLVIVEKLLELSSDSNDPLDDENMEKAFNWWELVSPTHKNGHPTEKPVGIIEKPMRFSSNAGSICYDPFLGSGTTLIACERLGRKCRAVEISPAYCAVSIQRWVDVTGGVPELLSS